MNHKTKVKLGGITNLSDARFAAAAGVDYIGFCFDTSSPNYIPPIKAKEMIDWIAGSPIIGEFGDQNLEEIKDISELLGLEALEVNNYLIPDELKELNKAIIKKINIDAYNEAQLVKELEAYHIVADAFHLYSEKQTTPGNKNLIQDLCKTYPIIWGFSISNHTVLDLIEQYKPYGINLIGGEEEKAGIKDFDELNEILEKILPI